MASVVENRRHFANESAENLGTRLLHGHVSTIATPAIARRNHDHPRSRPPQRKFLPWAQPSLAGCRLLRSCKIQFSQNAGFQWRWRAALG